MILDVDAFFCPDCRTVRLRHADARRTGEEPPSYPCGCGWKLAACWESLGTYTLEKSS